MLIVHVLFLSFIFFFFLFSTRFHFNPKPTDGELFICCGQLVGKKGGPRHINCPGSNSGYRVGGLFLEMEHCPFMHCASTFIDPESNISHQEEVHRSVRTWMCTVCEINFVSEGVSLGTCYPFITVQWATQKTLTRSARTVGLSLSQHKVDHLLHALFMTIL